jgi:hypothetical protein
MSKEQTSPALFWARVHADHATGDRLQAIAGLAELAEEIEQLLLYDDAAPAREFTELTLGDLRRWTQAINRAIALLGAG